jgi:hypothetical protein
LYYVIEAECIHHFGNAPVKTKNNFLDATSGVDQPDRGADVSIQHSGSLYHSFGSVIKGTPTLKQLNQAAPQQNRLHNTTKEQQTNHTDQTEASPRTPELVVGRLSWTATSMSSSAR